MKKYIHPHLIKVLKFSILGCIAGIALSVSAQAQILNFQASAYTTGSSTWTDSSGNNIVATASGTPVGEGGDINTTAGSFTFNADSVPGLLGLTNYTIAIGFTANSTGAAGGGQFYNGTFGIVGGDIPNSGQGDSGFALTTDGGGQLVAGLGIANDSSGNGPTDVAVYATGQSGTFATQTPLGAVLVVNGSAGTLSLFINGSQVDTQSGLTMLGFGFTNQTSGNGTGGIYNYGIGQVVGGGGDLDGNITQFQIYGSALSNTDAEALSNAVSEASVPEPSTLALLSAAFVGVFAWNLRRRVRSLKLWPSFTSL